MGTITREAGSSCRQTEETKRGNNSRKTSEGIQCITRVTGVEEGPSKQSRLRLGYRIRRCTRGWSYRQIYVSLISALEGKHASLPPSNIPQPSSESQSPYRRRMGSYYVGLSDNPAIAHMLKFFFHPVKNNIGIYSISRKVQNVYRMNYIRKISVHVLYILNYKI